MHHGGGVSTLSTYDHALNVLCVCAPRYIEGNTNLVIPPQLAAMEFLNEKGYEGKEFLAHERSDGSVVA